MTTIYDDVEDRLIRLGPVTLEQGVEKDLFSDPTGVFPTLDGWYSTSLPRVSFGGEYTSLSLGGGFDNTEIASGSPIASMRTRNRAIVTASGHNLELDDTPGNERIILRHNSGNGIEIRPDGTMIIAAGKQVISVTRDQNIIIEGNATIIYGGNVDMQVAGDYNLSVSGNYNLSVGENRNENVEGSYRTTVEGNTGHIIKGNESNTVLGTSTSTVLGDNNIVTKGVARYTSEGNMKIASGAEAQISAKTKLFQSSSNMNIAASDISVFGATGTIGGTGIVYYGKGATFGEGVTAPTFHGDLDGTASFAIQSDVTNSQNYADPDPGGGIGSAQGYTVTDTATPTTAAPTATILNDYLNNTAYGAVDVRVDIGNHFLNALNRSDATGGLSTRDLSTSEIRALLRTEGVRNITSFVGNSVATGRLSPAFSQSNPPRISRVSAGNQEPYRGNNPLGNRLPGGETRFLAPDDLTDYNFSPEYIIGDSINVSRAIQLATGIYLSTFTGGIGQVGRLSTIPIENRAQYARNLQPNAELLRRIRSNRENDFKNHRLIVVEALYNPEPAEINSDGWDTSINKYRSEGRAVVYELHDSTGKIDAAKTFDLAVYLKTVTSFEKLILDYDTYEPDGSLNAQLIFVTPRLNESYEVTDGNWFKAIETRFNGRVTSSSDLVEFTS
jgi:hypothetical protein